MRPILPDANCFLIQVLAIVPVLFAIPVVTAMQLIVDVPILVPIGPLAAMRLLLASGAFGMLDLPLAFCFTDRISSAPMYPFSIAILS
jgi:hypothetical protein